MAIYLVRHPCRDLNPGPQPQSECNRPLSYGPTLFIDFSQKYVFKMNGLYVNVSDNMDKQRKLVLCPTNDYKITAYKYLCMCLECKDGK